MTPKDDFYAEPNGDLSYWPARRRREQAADDDLLTLERLRDEWARLSRDYEDLKLELTEFRIRYHVAVGAHFVELERLKLRVSRLRVALDMVARVKDLSASDLSEWVAIRTREQCEQVSRLEEEVAADKRLGPEARRGVQLSTEERRLLRRLYRRLAKQFHPDLQVTPEARKLCERIMARISELYAAGDLEGLELLAEEEGSQIYEMFLDDKEYEAWVHSRIDRLKQRIAELRIQIDEVKGCDLFALSRRYADAQKHGRDLFEELAHDAEAEIEEQMRTLQELEREAEALAPDVRQRVQRIMEDTQ